MLINAKELDRVGDDWTAKVSEQEKSQLDRKALENHFGADTLQPFMRTSVIKMLRLTSSHLTSAGYSTPRRCRSTIRARPPKNTTLSMASEVDRSTTAETQRRPAGALGGLSVHAVRGWRIEQPDPAARDDVADFLTPSRKSLA
jgi:hypothetical protein